MAILSTTAGFRVVQNDAEFQQLFAQAFAKRLLTLDTLMVVCWTASAGPEKAPRFPVSLSQLLKDPNRPDGPSISPDARVASWTAGVPVGMAEQPSHEIASPWTDLLISRPAGEPSDEIETVWKDLPTPTPMADPSDEAEPSWTKLPMTGPNASNEEWMDHARRAFGVPRNSDLPFISKYWGFRSGLAHRRRDGKIPRQCKAQSVPELQCRLGKCHPLRSYRLRRMCVSE